MLINYSFCKFFLIFSFQGFFFFIHLFSIPKALVRICLMKEIFSIFLELIDIYDSLSSLNDR
jgi:hypothetical protein